MTRKEALAKHRQMWNMIADMIEEGVRFKSPFDYKSVAIRNIEGYDKCITSLCYCCEAVVNCSECLVVWEDETWIDCYCMNSNYDEFMINVRARDYDAAAYNARKIANLPARYKKDEI